MTAAGKSNQSALFLDSTGRTYAVPAHQLPSARGQGEPLTSRIDLPTNAALMGVMMGEDHQPCLLASDAGYGFIAKLSELHTKNKKGKASLSIPEGGNALKPRLINDLEKDYIAALTNSGQLLLFKVADLPQLAKGKGNKIINISSKKFKTREEYLIDIAVIGETDELTILSGKRKLTLKKNDLKHFLGERGQRGGKLPRGFQHADGFE
jgi:topoisomerase-4 subunit A